MGSGENCGYLELMDAEMAGPMGLKLRGMVEVMGEKVLLRYKIPLSKGLLQTENLI